MKRNAASFPLPLSPPPAPKNPTPPPRTTQEAGQGAGVLDGGALSGIVDSLGWATLRRLRPATSAINTFAQSRRERLLRMLRSERTLYLSDAAAYKMSWGPAVITYQKYWRPVLSGSGIATLRARFDDLLHRQTANSSRRPIVIVVDASEGAFDWEVSVAVLDFARHIRECGHPNVTTIATEEYCLPEGLFILAAGKHRYALRNGEAFIHASSFEVEEEVEHMLACSTAAASHHHDRIRTYLTNSKGFSIYTYAGGGVAYDGNNVSNEQLKEELGLIDEFIDDGGNDEELVQLVRSGRTIGPLNLYCWRQ